MTRQDDELVRRYHEASEQEDARPGAHVREAVRAHAQMVANCHDPCGSPWMMEDTGGVRASTGRGRSIL